MKLILEKWFHPPSAPAEFEVLIRPISWFNWIEINELVEKHGDGAIPVARKFLEVGVKDWRGVDDDDGVAVPYSLDDLAQLPVGVVREIHFGVRDMSAISEDAVKNSESQSISPTEKGKARANSTAGNASMDATATKATRPQPPLPS